MKFEIILEVNDKTYRMHVERIYQGESVERYTVSAGGKQILLQNNRPEIIACAQKKKIAWKILSGDFGNGKPDDIAFTMQRIFRLIEEKVTD